MRLLVVGHSYVTAFAQDKYVAFKRLRPALGLCIVTPRKFHHLFGNYHHELNPALRRDEVLALPDYFGGSHMRYLLAPLAFARVLRRFRPDLIHIEEDPHSVVGFETVLLARLFVRRAALSFFLWDNLARRPPFPLNLIKTVLTRFALARAALVVCGNREARELLHRVKRYRGRSTVLPQIGLDPGDYEDRGAADMRSCWVAAGGAPLVGFIGRLVEEKGLRLLLEALEDLLGHRWSLVIVGGGPMRAELENVWRDRLAGRLTLVDAVPHRAVSSYLKCLDVFVLPSLTTPTWKEQFGLTLAQAMMAGVACIGSSSGAIPEVLGPGGLVFEQGNRASLRQALERLLVSESLRRGCAAAGRAHALAHYTHVAVARGYLEQFESDAQHAN